MSVLGSACPAYRHSCSCHLQMDCCNLLYMELALKSILKLELVDKAVVCTCRTAHITPLLMSCIDCKFASGQIQDDDFNFKAFHDMGPDYLRDHLSPVISAYPITSCKEGMPWLLSARDLHLVGPRRCAFLTVVAALRNILPPEIRLFPSCLIFWKVLKMWLCDQAWAAHGTGDLSRWHHFWGNHFLFSLHLWLYFWFFYI